MCIELFLGNLFGRVVYVCHISSNITLPIVVLTMTQCETDMVMWHFFKNWKWSSYVPYNIIYAAALKTL